MISRNWENLWFRQKIKTNSVFWVFGGKFIELKLGQNNVFLMYIFLDEIPKNSSLCIGSSILGFRGQNIELELGKNNVFFMYFLDEIP